MPRFRTLVFIAVVALLQVTPLHAVPAVQSFTLSNPAPTGGESSTATLTLTESLGGNLTVDLRSNNPAAKVPASFQIPAGSRSGSFQVRTTPVAGPVDVVITATATSSFGSLSKTVTMRIFPPSLSSLTLASTDVVGGNSVTGTVKMNAEAPAGGMAINLTSSETAAPVPPSVTIPAGATGVNFDIATAKVSNSKTSTISASLRQVTKSATLNLKLVSVASLTLSSSDIRPGVPVTATITTDGPGPHSYTISDSAGAIRFVGQQIVSSGTRGTLTLEAAGVGSITPTTITIAGNPARTAQATVHPPEIKTVTVGAFAGDSASRLPGGPAAIVRVVLSGPAPDGYDISVTSSAAIVAPVRPTFTIDPRRNSIDLGLTTQPVSADTPVTITVSRGSDTRSVNFSLVPPTGDTILKGATGAPAGLSGGNVNSGYAVRLNAPAPAGGITIPLTANLPNTVPESVTVAAGQLNSNTFDITPPAVSSPTQLSVSAPNKVLRTFTIAPPAVATLSLSSPTVAGGTEVVASVILNGPAPSGGFPVPISSNNTNAATVPSAPFSVPAGQTTASFRITTLTVPNDTTVVITAGGRTQTLVVRAGS